VAEPFIRVSGLRKVYRKGNEEFLAIYDASFEVAAGELVSLVGPSGCGKTTLLKILAGLQDYDSGQAHIGTAAHPFDPSRDIGMVFQQALLLKWRRVLQNVMLPAEILGLPIAQAANGRATSWPWSGSPASRTNILMNFPAACSNAPRLHARWSTIRNSY